jgi:hypothetical protein
MLARTEEKMRAGVFALACLATLLNAGKPLTVDDSVYYLYARHIADHPLDPYGFRLLEGGLHANEVLAPPGLLYWWAGTLHLTGERPFLWKLGLLPLVLLFAFAFAALCRRFCAGLELPLLALTLFSPAFLPCLNLMLDVPALALGLAALHLFLTACERASPARAALAGLLAGLAMQTKYTAFLVPALFLLAGLWQRRLGLAVLSAGLAVLLFAGWEGFVALRYGDSHFLLALRQRQRPLLQQLRLARPLVSLLGGTAPALALLGLAALRASRRALGAGLLLLAAGYLAVLLTPPGRAVLWCGPRPDRPLLTVNSLVFGALGLAVWAVLGAVVWCLWRAEAPGIARTGENTEYLNADRFLALWLALEVLGYFALTPYPAVRRILGVVVVAALLVGRLAARADRRAALGWGAAGVSAALGLLCFLADREAYHAEQQAVGRALRHIRRRDPEATVWYHGVGCFEFYAGRAGLRLVPLSGPGPRRGDWLVVLPRRRGVAVPTPRPGWGAPCEVTHVRGALPVRSAYQIGGTPIQPRGGPLVEIDLYRCPGG